MSNNYEYVVVSTYASGDTKVAGPYSERQAARVAENTVGDVEVVRIVRPVYWTPEDEDLARYQPTLTEA